MEISEPSQDSATFPPIYTYSCVMYTGYEYEVSQCVTFFISPQENSHIASIHTNSNKSTPTAVTLIAVILFMNHGLFTWSQAKSL